MPQASLKARRQQKVCFERRLEATSRARNVRTLGRVAPDGRQDLSGTVVVRYRILRDLRIGDGVRNCRRAEPTDAAK